MADSWANIKAGRCAVGPITAFDTADFKVKLAAEVKDFDPAARIDKREARKMARFTQFAVAAADEAVRDSGLAAELTRLAKENGLIVTGGTDYHGINTVTPRPVGAFTTGDEMIARIGDIAKARKATRKKSE